MTDLVSDEASKRSSDGLEQRVDRVVLVLKNKLLSAREHALVIEDDFRDVVDPFAEMSVASMGSHFVISSSLDSQPQEYIDKLADTAAYKMVIAPR